MTLGRVPCTGHECQKHPSTNTATRAFRKARSARRRDSPGSGWSTRYLAPAPKSSLRRAISGAVSRLRTLLILRDVRSAVHTDPDAIDFMLPLLRRTDRPHTARPVTHQQVEVHSDGSFTRRPIQVSRANHLLVRRAPLTKHVPRTLPGSTSSSLHPQERRGSPRIRERTVPHCLSIDPARCAKEDLPDSKRNRTNRGSPGPEQPPLVSKPFFSKDGRIVRGLD